MNITLKRGPNLEAHLTVVQYIKGVGPQRAKALIRGETVTIELETPSRDVVIRNLRKLAADGALVIEGLLGMTESNSSAETTTVGAVNPATDLAEALARVLSGVVNEDKVKSIVDRQINEALSGIATTRIELTREDQEPVIIEGLQHPMFTRLLKMVTCRAANGYVPNIWIAGEKSSGKSHAGRAVAQALKLPFYVMGTLAMAHEAIGFVDGNGKYHSTPFVDAFVGGGVLQMDEIDSYEAHPTLSLNGPLANNYMTLPDGRFVERHRDCIIIGGANTWGMGATNEYIGRNKLDAAFLSRFPAKLTWNIDPALEQAFCGNVRFAERVQRARARAKSAGLKLGIDTRHTAAGAAFIAGGFTEDEAADMTYLAGLSDEQRKIVEGV